MTQGFPAGLLTPAQVVVTDPGGRLSDAQLDAVADFTAEVSARPDVAGVVSITTVLDERAGGHTRDALTAALASSAAALDGVVDAGGGTTVVTVAPRTAADTAESTALVDDLRDVAARTLAPSGAVAHVGGAPAEIADIQHESSRAMPLVIAAVLGASWFLLMWAFRSVLLPFKAIAMNLLTSGAAFGAAVLIFQEGHGAELLGVDRTGFIQAVLPLYAFALVFGLSMDYEVFMLSRMREEWDRTGDNELAVRLGMVHTARVITAAASIMVVVFASFMLTSIVEIKQMGFMLGFAVLIDATVVRLLLVPALMRLMGRWNWWLPGRRTPTP
jgi:RND superfamily putative drug exporter